MKKLLVLLLIVGLLITGCGGAPQEGVSKNTNNLNSVEKIVPEYCTVAATTKGDGYIGEVFTKYHVEVLRCEYESEVCWITVVSDGTAIDCFDKVGE